MIITLLSDYGYQDNFVAVAKGILLRRLPQATLIDLNHGIEPFHLLQCSYQLRGAYARFPEQTIHLSLFNIFGKVPAGLLVAEIESQYVISADNGLLPMAFNDMSMTVYRYRETAQHYEEWLDKAAQLISLLGTGKMDAEYLEPAEPGTHPVLQGVIVKDDRTIECKVIHIDRYENVVINITRQQFEAYRKGRRFRISFVRDSIDRISEHYADVPEGEKLCLFNSSGFMELAINGGKASSLLGLRLMQQVDERLFIYQNIKIEFL